MSLAQTQAAIAELIRLPELNRGEGKIDTLIAQYDLTSEEQEQIKTLSEDHNLRKYGRTMAFVRWETIQKQTPFSKKFWNTDAIEYIWRYRFEPTACRVRFKGLGRAFLEFVTSDARSIEILYESAPPFIHDLFKFERAQARVRLEHLQQNLSVPEGSLLVHRAFDVADYEYKISDYIVEVSQRQGKEINELAPAQGKETLLVIPETGDSGNCRFFEVETPVKEFLARQLEPNPSGETLDSYEDLVQLGLCHKRS